MFNRNYTLLFPARSEGILTFTHSPLAAHIQSLIGEDKVNVYEDQTPSVIAELIEDLHYYTRKAVVIFFNSQNGKDAKIIKSLISKHTPLEVIGVTTEAHMKWTLPGCIHWKDWCRRAFPNIKSHDLKFDKAPVSDAIELNNIYEAKETLLQLKGSSRDIKLTLCLNDHLQAGSLFKLLLKYADELPVQKIDFKTFHYKSIRMTREQLEPILEKFPNCFEKYAPLKNGIRSLQTGIYPKHVLTNGIKHLEVSDDELLQNGYDDYLSMNSAIVKQAPLNSDGFMYICGPYLCERDPETYKENHLLSHVHSERLGKMNITNSPVQIRHQIRSVSDCKDEDPAPFFEISNPSDLKIFIEDIDHYKRTSTLKNAYILHGNLKNMCMWSSERDCLVQHLPRASLDKKGFHVCHGATIGDKDSSLDELQRTVKKKMEKERIVRGCSSCPVRDTCSKCAFLPDYMSREEYCSIRVNQPYIQQYLNVVGLLKYLLHEKGCFKGVHVSDIQISSNLSQPLLRMNSKGSSFIRDYVFVFSYGDRSYLVDNESYMMKSMTKPERLVIEHLYAGYNEELLVEMVNDYFNTDEYKVADFCRLMIQFLSNHGLLHEKYYIEVEKYAESP